MDSVLELASDYTTEIVTAIVLGVVFFLLLRRYLAARRAQRWTSAPPTVTFTPSASQTRPQKPAVLPETALPTAQKVERPASVAPAALVAVTPPTEKPTAPLTATPTTTLAKTSSNTGTLPEKPSNVANFGAYRIEQEVNKLAQGQPHRIEVLSSRAAEDRKAIEASLLRALTAAGDNTETRERICRALEDYGFIARRCAELLLAPEYYERAAAAKMLGATRSQAALPFLLEGLYDTDESVRLQAVSSIGELRLPAAIGALLDLARRHPEIPQSVISQALNACSVEALSFFNFPAEDFTPVPLLLGDDDFLFDDDEEANTANGDAANLADNEAAPNSLPPGDNDEAVLGVLMKLERATPEQRTELYTELGQLRTRFSVLTLTEAAMCDATPAVRAAAVTALCEIDHPSGFAPILLAVGDESREVRAAAARSLSRLSFERAEAYSYLTEHESPANLVALAQACIKAGMAGQAISRLVSADPRQAYESFTLLALLVKAGEINPLLEAVAQHPSKEVRLNVLRLLVNAPQPEVVGYLRQVAVGEGIADDMRNALLETIYKIEEAARRRTPTILNDNLASRVA